MTAITSRSRWIGPSAVFLALLVVCSGTAWVMTDDGGQPAPAVMDVTAALPASVMLHVDYDGAAGANNCRQLAISELWREPQMKGFMAPVMEFMNAMSGGMSEEMASEIGISLDDLSTIGESQLTISLVDFQMGEQGPDVDVLITLDLAKDKTLVKRIQDAVSKLVEKEMGAPTSMIDLGGVQGTSTSIDGVNVVWAPMGNHLVIGTQVGTVSAVLARMKAQSSVGGLLENQNFVKARTRIAPTGEPVMSVYADVSRFLTLGENMMGPDWEEIAPLISLMGYDSMKDIAYGISFEDRAIVDRIWVGTPKGAGGIYGSFKHSKAPLRTAQMAPKDSFLYYAFRLNLSEMVGTMMAALETVDPNAGDEIDGFINEMDGALGFSVMNDVLPAIGEEMSFWVGEAPFGSMIPEMVMAIEMKDRAKIEACIEKARTNLDQDSLVNTFKFSGREIGYMDMGKMMSGNDFGPGFKPCWMMDGDFMIMALAPQTLKNYLVAQQAQRPSFKDNDDMKSGLAHLRRYNPEAGQDGMFYIDIGSALAMMADTAAPILQSIHMPAEAMQGLEVDMNLYPTGDVWRRHLFGMTSTTTIGDDGMLSEIHSPMGYGTMVGGAMAVGAAFFFIAEGEAMAAESAEWEDWEEVEPVPEEKEEMEDGQDKDR